jgi:tetratricopeptide (TPR) repeat protein
LLSDSKKIFMNRNQILLIFFFLILFVLEVNSQISFTSKEINSEFDRGMEFFNKEKYPAAIKLFDSFLKNPKNENNELLPEAQYYSSLAALKLFHPDGEYRMLIFISGNPGNAKINDASLALADYFYQNKNYRKSIIYYGSVDRNDLSSDKLPEYCFRYGYSQFIKGDPKKALVLFAEIKDKNTDYSPPALYYYSHIAYDQKMYQAALEGFKKLQKDETFGSVVPFYIVQILYMQKDYDGILALAPDLLSSAGKMRAVELYRFIGDAYYNKGNYKEAIGYLEKYSAGAKASGREDKYQLGYCYYKNGEPDKAVKIFLELTAQSDILSQNIWYLIGDCYIQKGDKKNAQFAFGQASQLDFDKKIREESLFNYAKLTFETSNSPFGEAIAAFQQYIELYPGSDRIEQVYDYLVASYMQLKNYKAALASLDKIKNKDNKLEEAYQRVAFFRGLELFKNMEIEASINMFDKSLKYEKYNRTVRARAIYWRGEAWYRLGQFNKAITDYEEFMGIPGSLLLAEYVLVRYNLGYAFYNIKDYSNSLNHFKSFETDIDPKKSDILADARNRIADCYYITTNYRLAIEYYDKVIDYGKVDADYAMNQKGFALGLVNDQKGKVSVLTSLISKFPKSSYIPGALFERGRAYILLKERNKGESDLTLVINDFPKSPFVPRAIVQLGLLCFDSGDNAQAVTQFRKVIENFKSTPEARSALTGLKNTYIEMNDVETYFTYVKTLEGYGDINLAEKDSLMYGSGEKLYMTGNCGKASEIFRKYLDEFQNGNFRINAQYYLADCAFSSGNKEEALKYYMDVIKIPNNDFISQALIAASSILFDKEDYQKSLPLYEELENVSTSPENIALALKGELRSAYQSGDAPKTISIAVRIAASSKIPEELMREAIFMSGKAHYSQNEYDEALRDFRKVSGEVTSAEGAESKYRVAEILYKKGQIPESEKIVNEFIDQNTPHQYWTASMFILLSDICVKKGDKVMAQATLKGLKDNYPNDSDGIIDEVRAKLDSINPRQEAPSDTLKVQHDSSSVNRK